MPTCKDCAVKYSNKRMKALGKGKLTPERQKAWYRERQNNIDFQRELKGAPASKVPIVDLDWWIKRPLP
jgi:hypothetical protein